MLILKYINLSEAQVRNIVNSSLHRLLLEKLPDNRRPDVLNSYNKHQEDVASKFGKSKPASLRVRGLNQHVDPDSLALRSKRWMKIDWPEEYLKDAEKLILRSIFPEFSQYVKANMAILKKLRDIDPSLQTFGDNMIRQAKLIDDIISREKEFSSFYKFLENIYFGKDRLFDSLYSAMRKNYSSIRKMTYMKPLEDIAFSRLADIDRSANLDRPEKPIYPFRKQHIGKKETRGEETLPPKRVLTKNLRASIRISAIKLLQNEFYEYEPEQVEKNAKNVTKIAKKVFAELSDKDWVNSLRNIHWLGLFTSPDVNLDQGYDNPVSRFKDILHFLKNVWGGKSRSALSDINLESLPEGIPMDASIYYSTQPNGAVGIMLDGQVTIAASSDLYTAKFSRASEFPSFSPQQKFRKGSRRKSPGQKYIGGSNLSNKPQDIALNQEYATDWLMDNLVLDQESYDLAPIVETVMESWAVSGIVINKRHFDQLYVYIEAELENIETKGPEARKDSCRELKTLIVDLLEQISENNLAVIDPTNESDWSSELESSLNVLLSSIEETCATLNEKTLDCLSALSRGRNNYKQLLNTIRQYPYKQKFRKKLPKPTALFVSQVYSRASIDDPIASLDDMSHTVQKAAFWFVMDHVARNCNITFSKGMVGTGLDPSLWQGSETSLAWKKAELGGAAKKVINNLLSDVAPFVQDATSAGAGVTFGKPTAYNPATDQTYGGGIMPAFLDMAALFSGYSKIANVVALAGLIYALKQENYELAIVILGMSGISKAFKATVSKNTPLYQKYLKAKKMRSQKSSPELKLLERQQDQVWKEFGLMANSRKMQTKSLKNKNANAIIKLNKNQFEKQIRRIENQNKLMQRKLKR